MLCAAGPVPRAPAIAVVVLDPLDAARREWKRLKGRPPGERHDWLTHTNTRTLAIELHGAANVAKMIDTLERRLERIRCRACGEQWVDAAWRDGQEPAHPLTCWCEQCRGHRFFPNYYRPPAFYDFAVSYECYLEAQAVLEEGIPVPPSSPGVVIRMSDLMRGRRKNLRDIS